MSRFRNVRATLFAMLLATCGLRPAMAQVPAAVPDQGQTQQPILRSLDDELEQQGNQAPWIRTIHADLMAEKFDELDWMADRYRRQRTRLTGGGWRLRTFYDAVNPAMATEKDTADHLARLERWMKRRPESITARVAYASSLIRWAWVARGNGPAAGVAPEGWRLFEERIARARQVLDDAAEMKPMCPEWFSEMLTVGLADDWGIAKEKDILERGIKLEPDYFYLYREYAYYLLPRWYGQPGDASKFAKDAADRVGGEEGDIVYYHVAEELIRRHWNQPVAELDWTRIQRGWTALTARFGVTKGLENRLAYIAYEYRDRAVTRRQFEEIGENWSKGVWLDRAFFDKVRAWAERHAADQVPGQMP